MISGTMIHNKALQDAIDKLLHFSEMTGNETRKVAFKDAAYALGQMKK